MHHFIPTGFATWIARLALLFSFCAGLATAQINSDNYVFLLGSGFLCDGSDASTCPAAAKASQGDILEMSGAGMFNIQDKSVQAAGTFTHKAPNGNVLETGVWIADGLISFDSYGATPGAFRQHGSALALQPFGPKRLLKSFGPVPLGGLAMFRIRLLPMMGASKAAVLQVNCALGNVPRERSVEGIRVTLEKNGSGFSEELGGHAMFLSTLPEAGAIAKARENKTESDPAQKPDN